MTNQSRRLADTPSLDAGEAARLGQVFLAPPDPPDQPFEPEMTIAFVLAPNFTLLPLAGFIETVRHAADVADFSRQIYCRWTLLGSDLDPVRASCGLEVRPWQAFDDPADYDYVVVAGGLLPSCLDAPAETFAFIRRAAERGVQLISLCTGGFLLAKAGLMGGRRCSVHPRHRNELAALFPDVIPVTTETYVKDGNIITCMGGAAAIDLAANLVTDRCGRARAIKSLRSMLVEQHRAAHQVPHLSYQRVAACGDPHVERAVALMEENIGSPYPIGELARRLGITVARLDRAFARRVGAAPSEFWRRMRLEHAHWLLCNTSRKVTDIALECGFYDSTHFSRTFKAAYGETPRHTRARNRRLVSLHAEAPVMPAARPRLPQTGPAGEA